MDIQQLDLKLLGTGVKIRAQDHVWAMVLNRIFN